MRIYPPGQDTNYHIIEVGGQQVAVLTNGNIHVHYPQPDMVIRKLRTLMRDGKVDQARVDAIIDESLASPPTDEIKDLMSRVKK